MKNAFIATVGIGTGPESDITKPLIESIREANPDFLLLFATEESFKNAQIIKDSLCRNDDNTEICKLEYKEDVEKIFKKISDKIVELISKGYKAENIIADFTTGTKPMAAGLVLAAIKFNIKRLKYIMVERDTNRKICEGTERTLTFEPKGIYASYTIDIAINFIQKFRFESAKEILGQINRFLLSELEKKFINDLETIASAYDFWDKFEHIKFRDTYNKIEFSNPLLDKFKVGPEVLEVVHQLGKDSHKNVISDNHIVDLINNATRRVIEGKYDDAVARLYRAMEMLAQWRLENKYKIRANDIDLNNVPKSSVDWLNKYRDKSDNKIKISLHRCFQLLSEFDDELGKKFEGDKKLHALLNKRNNSILAHGTVSISKDECKSLMELVIQYSRAFIENFDEKSKILQFPWVTSIEDNIRI